MFLFHTDPILIEKNWHKNYNDSNLSQNLYFSTDLKACVGNCGGSNHLNCIKIDPQPQEGVASNDFISC